MEEHHHFPNKHTNLLSRVKYTRKKINEGTLEEWKRVMFEEIAEMRDLSIHTCGRSYKNNPLTVNVSTISMDNIHDVEWLRNVINESISGYLNENKIKAEHRTLTPDELFGV